MKIKYGSTPKPNKLSKLDILLFLATLITILEVWGFIRG